LNGSREPSKADKPVKKTKYERKNPKQSRHANSKPEDTLNWDDDSIFFGVTGSPILASSPRRNKDCDCAFKPGVKRMAPVPAIDTPIKMEDIPLEEYDVAIDVITNLCTTEKDKYLHVKIRAALDRLKEWRYHKVNKYRRTSNPYMQPYGGFAQHHGRREMYANSAI
jgi:hypothetical protein